jgi:hypothetical protein
VLALAEGLIILVAANEPSTNMSVPKPAVTEDAISNVRSVFFINEYIRVVLNTTLL